MKQALELGQHLVMTPRMRQAIRLLPLSSIELRGELRQPLAKEAPARSGRARRLAMNIESAGFRVARRTVSKYRESPGIPPFRGKAAFGFPEPGRKRPLTKRFEGISMQLNVTGRHLEVTEALESYVRTKLERLERHFDHVTNVHVVLSVEKARHRAEATVHVTGRELFADAVEEEMYAAIDALADKLDRQIKRYKEKTTDHHRSSGGIKSHPPSAP